MEKDVGKFWEQDAAEHMGFAYQYGKNPDVRYPLYEIRKDMTFDILAKRPKGRLLDAGCGAAHVIVEAVEKGWDAMGFDFSPNMVKLAHDYLHEHKLDPALVHQGSISDLSAYPDNHFDAVSILGVSQYIPADEDTKAWNEVRRVLKPGGIVIIDWVNALFDLLTFNRFTLRFISDEILTKFFPAERISELEKRVAALMTNPDKPSTTGLYATRRDHVTKRTENPLTVAERMKGLGFETRDLMFYRLHAVPPLLFPDEPGLEAVAIAQEGKLAHHWIGNFIASAFITVLEKV
jgi:ubiquinone/menaquinone biosynthesis C-methylase UbiE